MKLNGGAAALTAALEARGYQVQGAGDGTGDLGHFDGMGETGAKQVAFVVHEHLGLVFQAPEGGRVDDAVPVPLEFAAVGRAGFVVASAQGTAVTGRVAGKR